MEKNKKKVLIIIGIVIGCIAVLTIVLSLVFKDEGGSKIDGSDENKTISKTISELKEERKYFTLQNIINKYYTLLANENVNAVYNMLDSSYIEDNNITSANIFDVITSDYDSTSYIVKNVYYNANSVTTYYFINGYLINVSMMEDDYEYNANVNYLVIVDENSNNFLIRPLSSEIDMNSYARNFDIKYLKIEKNPVTLYSVSEKNKLILYINEFLNLMFLDTDYAYSLLDDSMYSVYPNVNSFKTDIENIYNTLSATIFGYSLKNENDVNIYSVVDNKQNKIILSEYTPMKYKIAF